MRSLNVSEVIWKECLSYEMSFSLVQVRQQTNVNNLNRLLGKLVSGFCAVYFDYP